jgi:hypothetical protein
MRQYAGLVAAAALVAAVPRSSSAMPLVDHGLAGAQAAAAAAVQKTYYVWPYGFYTPTVRYFGLYQPYAYYGYVPVYSYYVPAPYRCYAAGCGYYGW